MATPTPTAHLCEQDEAKAQREWIAWVHERHLSSKTGEQRALRLAASPLDTFWAAAMVSECGRCVNQEQCLRSWLSSACEPGAGASWLLLMLRHHLLLLLRRPA